MNLPANPPSGGSYRRSMLKTSIPPCTAGYKPFHEKILLVAIDGKTLKGTRQQDGHQIHLLSAFLQQKGVVIANVMLTAKPTKFQPFASSLTR